MPRHNKRNNNRGSALVVSAPSQGALSAREPHNTKAVHQEADSVERFAKLRSLPYVDQSAPGNSPVISAEGYEHSPLGLTDGSNIASLPGAQQSPPADSMASASVSEKEELVSPASGNFVMLTNDERRKLQKNKSSKNFHPAPAANLPPKRHTDEELAAMAQRKKEESMAKVANMFGGRNNNSFSGSMSRLGMSTSLSRQSITSLTPSQRPPPGSASRSTLPPSAVNSRSIHPQERDEEEELPDGWTRRKIIPAADKPVNKGITSKTEHAESRSAHTSSPSKQKKAHKEELIAREPTSELISQPIKKVSQKEAPKKKVAPPPAPIVSVPLVAYAYRGPAPRPLPPITDSTPDVWFRTYREKILEEEAGKDTQRRTDLAQAKIDTQESIGYTITKAISDASAKLTGMAFVSRIEAENRYIANHENKANERFAKYFPQLAQTETILCAFDVNALHSFHSLRGHAILTKNHLCIVCKGKNTVPNLPQSYVRPSQLHPPQIAAESGLTANNSNTSSSNISLPSQIDTESSSASIQSESPNAMIILEAIPLSRIISIREGITAKSNGKVFVLDLPHDLIKGDALQLFCRDGLVYQLRSIRHPNIGSDGSMFDGMAVSPLHRLWNHLDHAWRAAGGGADSSIEFRDF